jgi:hypothetical protein
LSFNAVFGLGFFVQCFLELAQPVILFLIVDSGDCSDAYGEFWKAGKDIGTPGYVCLH